MNHARTLDTLQRVATYYATTGRQQGHTQAAQAVVNGTTTARLVVHNLQMARTLGETPCVTLQQLPEALQGQGGPLVWDNAALMVLFQDAASAIQHAQDRATKAEAAQAHDRDLLRDTGERVQALTKELLDLLAERREAARERANTVAPTAPPHDPTLEQQIRAASGGMRSRVIEAAAQGYTSACALADLRGKDGEAESLNDYINRVHREKLDLLGILALCATDGTLPIQAPPEAREAAVQTYARILAKTIPGTVAFLPVTDRLRPEDFQASPISGDDFQPSMDALATDPEPVGPSAFDQELSAAIPTPEVQPATKADVEALGAPFIPDPTPEPPPTTEPFYF